jgi:hypothetical protein
MHSTKLILPPTEIQLPVLGHRQVPARKALVDLDSSEMAAAAADVMGKGEANEWKKSAKALKECL